MGARATWRRGCVTASSSTRASSSRSPIPRGTVTPSPGAGTSACEARPAGRRRALRPEVSPVETRDRRMAEIELRCPHPLDGGGSFARCTRSVESKSDPLSAPPAADRRNLATPDITFRSVDPFRSVLSAASGRRPQGRAAESRRRRLMKQNTEASNGWLAERLAMGSASRVRQVTAVVARQPDADAAQILRQLSDRLELVPKTGVFKKRENSARSMSGGPPR